ncbi:hypothetical protein LXL04_027577 [Taraxacum kok-saghyz]
MYYQGVECGAPGTNRKVPEQANAIADWDRRILQNRDVLLKIEVDKSLQSVEEEAERIYKDDHGLLVDDEAASTRDAMYEQAEFVEREMEQMTEQIKSVIQTLNSNQVGEVEATPLDVVVQILNNQLSSLMWVDEKAEEFSSRIQTLAKQGPAAAADMGPKLWLSR